MSAKKSQPDKKRVSIVFDMPDKIGDELVIQRPIEGLEILVVRVPPKPLEAKDFVVVTTDRSRDLHVARRTEAQVRSRIVSLTWCSESTARPLNVGQRLDAVPQSAVTCSVCRSKLIAIGIQL